MRAAVQKQWESVTAKGRIFSVAKRTKAKCPSRAPADVTPLLSGSVWARDLYDYSSFLPQSPTITPSPAVNAGIARHREGEWHYTAGKAPAVGSFETCNRIWNISPFVQSLWNLKSGPFRDGEIAWGNGQAIGEDEGNVRRIDSLKFPDASSNLLMRMVLMSMWKRDIFPPDGSWPLFNEKEMPIKTARQMPSVHGERNSSL